MKPSIQQRRDEYHVTIATLLGCELAPWSAALLWRYKTPSGLGMAYTTAAHAARAWLTENNHDLDGWCENDEARTHGEEGNSAGN